jgi:hypothetical protein
VAGHIGLELKNVPANYRFEMLHRFAGIEPNSLATETCLTCGEREQFASFLPAKIILQYQSHKCSQF